MRLHRIARTTVEVLQHIVRFLREVITQKTSRPVHLLNTAGFVGLIAM
jgi:hypothetical protein